MKRGNTGVSAAILLFLAGATTCVPLPISAQEGSRTLGFNGLRQFGVSGRVVDAETGAPLDRATVQIRGAYAQLQTGTKQSGGFGFLRISAGSYLVIASAPGYDTASEPVTVAGADISGLVMALQPSRPSSPYEHQEVVSMRELRIPGEAKRAFGRGMDMLYRQKEPEQSIRFFREALEIHMDYDAAYVQLALAQLAMDESDKAMATLEQALERHPGNGLARELLGRVLVENGRPGAAISQLRQALEVNPDSWNAHLQLSRAFEASGDIRRALEHARSAHDLNPGTVQGHLTYYNLCAATGDLGAALAELDEILKLYPESRVSDELRRLRPRLEQAARSASGNETQH